MKKAIIGARSEIAQLAVVAALIFVLQYSVALAVPLVVEAVHQEYVAEARFAVPYEFLLWSLIAVGGILVPLVMVYLALDKLEHKLKNSQIGATE